MNYLLGIDVGKSQVTYSLAELETGEIMQRRNVPKGPFHKQPTEPADAPRVLDSYRPDLPLPERLHTYLAEGVRDFLGEFKVETSDIKGIGLSLAGKMVYSGRDGGDVVYVPPVPERFYANVGGGVKGVNATKSLQKLFPETPIVGGNDGNCSGNAQSLVYAGQELDPDKTFYLTVSTGIGGGGPGGDADEVGHLVVANMHPMVSLECVCGVKDCLEAYASGTGIANLAKRVIDLYTENPEGFTEFMEYERLGGRVENLGDSVERSSLRNVRLTSVDVCAALKEGDEFARYVLDTTARLTAEAIVGIAQIHDLERVGVGGGVGVNNPGYVEMIQDHVNRILVPGKNKLLPKGVVVEVSPLRERVKDYGALSQVIPEEHKTTWIDAMTEAAKLRK